MISLSAPSTAFTVLFCAWLEERGAIPPGAPLPDVVRDLTRRPDAILLSLIGKGERPIHSLWGFHQIKLRSAPNVEIPSEVETAFENLFVGGHSEASSIRRYFEKTANALARGVDLFYGKKPEIAWKRVHVAERRFAEDLEAPLSGAGRASNLGYHAANFALIGMKNRAALLFQTAITECRRIPNPWNLSRTLGHITNHLIEAEMEEKGIPIFEALIAKAGDIEDEECRQKTLREIARALPSAELGKSADALFEKLTEAAQKIRDEGYRRLVTDTISEARNRRSR